jgi:putative nucleotidyltransferase with HDIG domain
MTRASAKPEVSLGAGLRSRHWVLLLCAALLLLLPLPWLPAGLRPYWLGAVCLLAGALLLWLATRDSRRPALVEPFLPEDAEFIENLAQQVPGVIYQYRLWPDGHGSFPFATRHLNDIYELAPEEVREDASKVFERIHPEDLERVRSSILDSARALDVWICDYRVNLPRQGTRWCSGFARPQRLPDGSTLWHGFIEDSTVRKEMEHELRRSNQALQRSVAGTLEIISRIMDRRDPYTAGHQHRVGRIARLIGQELGLGQPEEELLELIGVVHDIGKIAVPTEILTKPARLSDIELQIVKSHAEAGYELLKDTDLPRAIIDAVHQHHERLDGSGYPQGLKGEEISLEARIIAVADVLESMSSHRPYRPALGVERAVAELQRGRGSSYDPEIVDIALRIVEQGRLPQETTNG